MSGRFPLLRIPACGLAAVLLLGGCDTVDPGGFSVLRDLPAVSAPEEPPPAPGMVRSGETFSGKVSWYSVRTNGGTKTASGEKFADHGDTAAHRTLPFGTLVEVTNLSNEQTIVLRINDRGPFKKDRVLDVSIGAARKLGFEKHGLASCRVEVLRPSPEEADGGPAETPAFSEPEGGE